MGAMHVVQSFLHTDEKKLVGEAACSKIMCIFAGKHDYFPFIYETTIPKPVTTDECNNPVCR